MMESMGNMGNSELNYKEAYSLLFNHISDMTERQISMAKEMIILQKQAEEICINGVPNRGIDDERIWEMLIDITKKMI